MTDFQPPPWDEPIDMESYLASIPQEVTARGVFFRTAIEQCRKEIGRAPVRRSYFPLLSYPVAELATVLVECSRLIYPELPIRRALRNLGRLVFTGIKSTATGGVLLRLAGDNLPSALKMVSKTYKLFANRSSAKVISSDADHFIVALRDTWTFPDAYHVGILKGGVHAYGRKATVAIRYHRACDIDLNFSLL